MTARLRIEMSLVGSFLRNGGLLRAALVAPYAASGVFIQRITCWMSYCVKVVPCWTRGA